MIPGSFIANNQQPPNSSNNRNIKGMENFMILDRLMDKLKKQYFNLVSQPRGGGDLLSLHTLSRDDMSKKRTSSKNSLRRNFLESGGGGAGGTVVSSLSNSAMQKSEKTLHS